MKIMMLTAMIQQVPQLISGAWDKLGIASTVSFFGVNVADKSGVIQLADDLSSEWGVMDWLSVGTGVTSVLFAIKLLFEIRLAYLKIKLADRGISDWAQ